MKNLSNIAILSSVFLFSCNPKVSINSGKNDNVTVKTITEKETLNTQVTYEETKEDRLLRYELIKEIKNYQPVMPLVETTQIYKVNYRSPKKVSFFLNEKTECLYSYISEVIKEKILEVNEVDQSYKIIRKSSPITESIDYIGEDSGLKDLCNVDIGQLNIRKEITLSLVEHISKMKSEAQQKLEKFSDMCRYGGTFVKGGSCLGHRISVEKVNQNDSINYILHSQIQGEKRVIDYSWSLSITRPYFTLGFVSELDGSTPEFETLDPHFYNQIKLLEVK